MVNGRSDALLQASRRLDWRFLLPDPGLGRVLYIGPSEGSLPESLQIFSGSLTIQSDMTVPAACQGAFDLVVMRAPSLRGLRRAAEALRPGGCLYAEIDGPLVRRRHAGALRPSRACAELRRLGLGRIALAWHWPSFDSCTRIVPLDNRASVDYAIDSGIRGPGALRVAAHAVLRPAVIERLGSSVSVVAQS